MNTAQLNALDELYMHLDREEDPWSVQLELWFEGQVDATRLATAVREAAGRHPMARARLADSSGTDVHYRWEIFDGLDDERLDVVDCESEEDLAALRERLFGFSPRLDRPGPFAIALAHHHDGDGIMLNLHHAAGDGISALRLLGSVLRAYAGEDDPLPGVDPLAVRDVGEMTKADSLATRLKRGRHLLRRGLDPPVRIAGDGGSDRPGYGFELLQLEPAEMATVRERRREGATVNDVLLAALAVTAREWNESRGGETGALSLTMPVNLRPPEWRYDVVGNYASYVAVRLPPDEQGDLDATIDAVAARTRQIKEDGIAGLLVWIADLPTVLPAGVKQRLPELLPLTGNRLVDTAVLSNLGRIESLPGLDDAGAARAVWFSPPGRMPLGVSLGVATLDERLFMTLRYRHALFDREAAADFFARVRRTLLS